MDEFEKTEIARQIEEAFKKKDIKVVSTAGVVGTLAIFGTGYFLVRRWVRRETRRETRMIKKTEKK
jgi:nitrate reductase gamma subunit